MWKYASDWTGEETDVDIIKAQYAVNGRLALEIYCDEGPYGRLTVNIDGPVFGDNYAYIDVNNMPGAVRFLESIGAGEATGYGCASGFVMYPLFRFNEEFLDGLKEA